MYRPSLQMLSVLFPSTNREGIRDARTGPPPLLIQVDEQASESGI
jgi:hypothetical protein